MIFRTLLLQFLVVLFAISMSDAVSAAEGMARADETVDHDERKTAHWRGAISPAQETNARMTVWAKSGRTFKYSKPGNGAGLSWDTITDTSSKAAFEAIVLASANHRPLAWCDQSCTGNQCADDGMGEIRKNIQDRELFQTGQRCRVELGHDYRYLLEGRI